VPRLHEQIKKRRIELGLTQEDLAQRVGYKTRSAITRIESGENDVNQSKIKAFAAALHTTPSYLMGWEDDTESAPGYRYIDPEALDLMNEMRERPELQTMFSISRKATKENIELVNKMLKALAAESEE
jgi:transcriptional regulator with XRE-family HTH domain